MCSLHAIICARVWGRPGTETIFKDKEIPMHALVGIQTHDTYKRSVWLGLDP